MRRRRRARRRIAELTGVPVRSTGPVAGGARGPLVVIGRSATSVVQWIWASSSPTPDDETSRIRGGALVLAAAVAAVTTSAGATGGGVIGGVVVVAGWMLPVLLHRRDGSRASRALAEETLLAVELCTIAVHTGADVPRTIAMVAPHVTGRLGAALGAVARGHQDGALLDDLLTSIVGGLGDEVVDLVALLRAAHVDGDRIAPALARLADRLRDDRRRTVEADARALSVRLLVPLVCCSLPGFLLTAVVPFVVATLGDLGGLGG